MTVRAQSIPARHRLPEHAHRWNQVVYTISGMLTAAADGRSFATSPEQAAWLPTGLPHKVTRAAMSGGRYVQVPAPSPSRRMAEAADQA